jgi:WD40 repeat protein
VDALGFSPGGDLLGTGSPDGLVRLLDAKTGELTSEIQGPGGAISVLTFHPNGRLLAVGGSGTKIGIYRVEGGAPVRELEGRTLRSIRALAFSPDGRLLVTAGNNVMGLWDAATGECLRQTPGPAMSGVAFSKDGRVLVASCIDQTIRIFGAAAARGLPEAERLVGVRLDGQDLVPLAGDSFEALSPSPGEPSWPG